MGSLSSIGYGDSIGDLFILSAVIQVFLLFSSRLLVWTFSLGHWRGTSLSLMKGVRVFTPRPRHEGERRTRSPQKGEGDSLYSGLNSFSPLVFWGILWTPPTYLKHGYRKKQAHFLASHAMQLFLAPPLGIVSPHSSRVVPALCSSFPLCWFCLLRRAACSAVKPGFLLSSFNRRHPAPR